MTSVKRRSDHQVVNGDGDKTPPQKKAKLTETDDQVELSPAQRKQIETNQWSAKIKRTLKVAPALHSNIGMSWFQALESEFSKPYFLKLSEFLEQERRKYVIYPPEDKVFSWTQMFPIHEVKVVILGQDPYHGVGQAHGLCFSVQKGIPPPPSLVNMYIELENDIAGFQKPSHGTLTGWAKQGVLLLNACLTVREHMANSHKDQGWEQFTDAVISWINLHLHGVVFLLWGAYAQKKASTISKSRHHILSCPHPSPLSAHRGFFGCKHFSKANDYLKNQGRKPIDWNDLQEMEDK